MHIKSPQIGIIMNAIYQKNNHFGLKVVVDALK